ncbi:retrovirus-related pol polyprotein from transposon TNT 1-94 [Tanacetum coccineum]
MTTLAEHIIVAGAENRPPMLEKSMYDSWASRIRLFIKGKKHGRMMLDSIDNGPLVYPTVEENRQTRPKKYSELTKAQQLQDDCDVQATNIILHGLPPDVYALVNHQEAAKDIWDRVKLLMKGTKLSYQERECRLYNLFDKFAYVQVNTKFLNALPPEWSKFVTDVKLAKSLYTTNYDQLYAYLSQHERHANEVRIMRERYPDPLALVSNSQTIYNPSQSPQHSVTQHSQADFPQLDFGLAFLIFHQGEDPIECINKAMAFVSAMSSSFVGTGNRGIAATSRGNYVAGQPRVVKCYNCQGEWHMARQCTQPKRPRNAAWFKEKLMLAEAHVLMENLSRCDSDVLSKSSFSETPVTSHIPVRIEAPSELPKVSLVNESLKKLKYQLANFDKVVKKRTTSDAITAGAWGFEHTKACFVKIIPFFKVLKDTFNAFDKTLLDEITEVQTVFNQMEAAVDQCSYLELETELLKKKDWIEKDVYDKLLKSYSTLEKHCISLELTTQLNQEIFQKDNFRENQNAPTFNHLFEINELKAQSQEKGTVIKKLKDRIKLLSGKDNVENVKKDIDEIETINIELEHTLKNELRKLKGKNIVDTAVSKPSATIAPGMFKLDIEPISHILKNNRDAHEELLVYVSQTCPISPKPSEKLVVVTPMNKDKRVRFAEPVTSSNNIPKQTDSLKTKDSNKLLLTSTGVKPTTSASGSKPSGNTKNNRITRPPSSNQKNKVEDHSRKVKSSLNKMNSVSEPISNAHVKHYVRNAKFESICAICRTFTIVGNRFPLTRITSTKVVPTKETSTKSVATPTQGILVYSKRPKATRSIGSSSKVKIVESKTSNSKEPNQSWGSTIFDVPSSSLNDCRFGNDHIAKIMGYVDYQMGNVITSRVYYVEGLGYNLFFVGQFCDSDLEVAFRKHTYFIRDLDGVDLLKGSRGLNLYTLSMDNLLLSSLICLLSKASKTKSWLWHQRLSHLNLDHITSLAKHGFVRGLPKLKYEKDHLCSACALGKSKKHSHKPKAKDSIQEKLYLLHMDLCGPMRIQSINGRKYILVIVDDYSRFTWVNFLRSKDEVLEFVIKFLKMIQVRLNVTVYNIRTDNGTEFVNPTLKDYYEEVKISHQTSVARTPQQNRVVERQNRTLVEAARTMLIFSKALKPDLSYFRVFGALCYPTNDNEDLGKLKPKADIGIFVGYAPAKKAFRIYNKRTRMIIETIHVDFDELTAMASEQFS